MGLKKYKHNIDDQVKVNSKAGTGMPNRVGEIGKIVAVLEKGTWDYEVQFDTNTFGKFKEDELDLHLGGMVNLTDHELHKQILDEIHHTYKIKNADYGNSFGDQYQEYGLLSAVIRLDDKFRRLKQLMKQEAQVKDESIRDTVLDAANYAIMTVMELDKEYK